MSFRSKDNISIVTAILPPSNARKVIDTLFQMGEHNSLMQNARGTLIRDRWYQSFLPVISPELEYLQFLVPDPQVDSIMDTIAATARLNLPGSGAVYSVPCDKVEYGDGFDLWSSVEDGDFNASIGLKENLTAIFCIAQSDQVDAISRAAMQAGAHGPVIYYCEGRGLRDRLGWLKITKKQTKEVICLIVDNVDKVAVTEAMIDAGKLDIPGHGFLYRMPVQKGLINLPSMVGNRGYTANLQQVIAAIDNLKGNTDWRDQSVIELGAAGKGAGISALGQFQERSWLLDQVCFGCIVSRKHSDTILDAMRNAGAHGANVAFARFIELEAKTTASGIRLNRERGVIRSVMASAISGEVMAAVRLLCEEQGIDDVCMFLQPITRGFTYIAPAVKEKVERTYRGARIAD